MSGLAARTRAMTSIVLGGRVLAVHGREDAIRSRLHGQMQERHQLRNFGMSRDQILAHVARMAGHVAKPLQPLDVGEAPRSNPQGSHARPPAPSP